MAHLSEKDFMYSPFLAKTNNNIWVAITESDLDEYPGMFYQGTSSYILKAAFDARMVLGIAPYVLRFTIGTCKFQHPSGIFRRQGTRFI